MNKTYRRTRRHSPLFYRRLRNWLLFFAITAFILLAFYIFNTMSQVRITGETG